MKECSIPSCVRDTNNFFCTKHKLAIDNIESSFKNWQLAYGNSYAKTSYLESLANDISIGAGVWVIEVANFMLRKDQ